MSFRREGGRKKYEYVGKCLMQSLKVSTQQMGFLLGQSNK
jgi:hypothetical protein